MTRSWILLLVCALLLSANARKTKKTSKKKSAKAQPGCLPHCEWECQSPKCAAKCTPQCSEPKCDISCEPYPMPDCQIVCAKPKCQIRCSDEDCADEGCPVCENVCEPASCKPDCKLAEPKCTPTCNKPECTWDCKKPENCAKPKCSLNCSKKGCGEGSSDCCSCESKEAMDAALTLASGSDETTPSEDFLPSLLELTNQFRAASSSMGSEQCCPCV